MENNPRFMWRNTYRYSTSPIAVDAAKFIYTCESTGLNHIEQLTTRLYKIADA